MFNCFCDNLGVITNVTILLTPAILWPNDTTSNDHNVYVAISNLVMACSPFQIHFLHIKGHQDSKQNQPLTIIKNFNVDCDHHAKKYTHESPHSSMALGNPAILIAQPHIIIKGKISRRDLLKALQTTTSTPSYQQYLKTKLQWTECNTKDIHLQVLKLSLASFPLKDQCQLVLFINDKLQLKASKAHPHHGSPLCPSCQWDQEDTGHFLACTHLEHKALFTKLKHDMTHLTQCLPLHPCLFTALWLGLKAARTASPYTDILMDILPPLLQPIQWQTWLEWEQLFQGCVFTTWAAAINMIHPQLAPTEEQVMIQLQKNDLGIYTGDMENEEPAPPLQCRAFQPPQLLPSHLNTVWTMSPSPSWSTRGTLLPAHGHHSGTPHASSTWWVQHRHKYFTQQLKAVKKQAALQMHDICIYFQTNTQWNNDLQPP